MAKRKKAASCTRWQGIAIRPRSKIWRVASWTQKMDLLDIETQSYTGFSGRPGLELSYGFLRNWEPSIHGRSKKDSSACNTKWHCLQQAIARKLLRKTLPVTACLRAACRVWIHNQSRPNAVIIETSIIAVWHPVKRALRISTWRFLM